MDPNRLDAARRNEPFYEGAECPRGHGTTRYTTSGKCRECAKERARLQYIRVSEQIKAAREEG